MSSANSDFRGTQKCGHPLAARKVSVTAVGPRAEDRRLETTCWACEVERLQR